MGFSTDTPTTAYHWIITVRFGNDSLATESGVTDVTARWRRADIYAEALNAVKKRTGTHAVHVVFFDVARNELFGGAR
ncbi:hypothetical protein ABH926_008138 [Catenulispora sp. GP43]|uniref:hypothetical protein n=1 Tax=Catenulispora sp. GP43 TaxID=3156263 RepID=UPI003518F73D